MTCAASTFALAQNAEVAPRSETDRLSANDADELQWKVSLLQDATAKPDPRRGAARELINHGWDPAIDAMRRMLSDPATDPGGLRAIALAVAAADRQPAKLRDPLIDLVGITDPQTAQAVASALRGYDDPKVVHDLLALAEGAGRAQRDQSTQLAAIDALAEYRRPQVAERLVALTAPTQPRSIQQAAFTALARLTGIARFGADAQAWADWWQHSRQLSLDQWQAELIRQLADRANDLRRQRFKLSHRLADLHGKLYNATSPDNRPALLIGMLDDPIDAVRIEALQLIKRAILNAQTDQITDDVRRAMRRQLVHDPNATVRADAAMRLHDLGDIAAPPLVVARLLEETEPSVQRAYLVLLTLTPVTQTVDDAVGRSIAQACSPALALIDQPDLQTAVASFLIVAHDTGRLSPKHTAEALRHAREHLKGDAPNVKMLILLGRLGQAEDWPTLGRMLDHESEDIRRAAAESYIDGAMPLDPLLAALTGPVLRPIALRAIEQRGGRLDVAVAMLGAPPGPEDASDPWRSAMFAVASRLEPVDLRALDDLLLSESAGGDLREPILKAAVANNGDSTPDPTQYTTHHVDLLLRLGALYQQTARPAMADAAYSRAELIDAITDDQAVALQLGRIEVHLASDQLQEAIAIADVLLASPSRAADVLDRFIDAAGRAVADRPDAAQAIIEYLLTLPADGFTQDQRDRLDVLRRPPTEPVDPAHDATTPDPADRGTSDDT
ncbi:MAG: hypothetical protein CMJ49_06570 [Planctomycetaceae bacterium]|nr:hypothetical protein [Planctomycetaceae bacterium]